MRSSISRTARNSRNVPVGEYRYTRSGRVSVCQIMPAQPRSARIVLRRNSDRSSTSTPNRASESAMLCSGAIWFDCNRSSSPANGRIHRRAPYPPDSNSAQNESRKPASRSGSCHCEYPWSRYAAQNRIIISCTRMSLSSRVTSSSRSRCRTSLWTGFGGGGVVGILCSESFHNRHRQTCSHVTSVHDSILATPNGKID